ncbi:MAG: hypothetical protein KC592_02820, partial [Nitrospira sp.]|nr:hypothetical protein [Nitrospira sp.]
MSNFLIIHFSLSREENLLSFSQKYSQDIQPVFEQVMELSAGVHFAALAAHSSFIELIFIYDGDETRFIEYLRLNLDGLFRELLLLDNKDSHKLEILEDSNEFLKFITSNSSKILSVPNGDSPNTFVYRALGGVSLNTLTQSLSITYPHLRGPISGPRDQGKKIAPLNPKKGVNEMSYTYRNAPSYSAAAAHHEQGYLAHHESGAPAYSAHHEA